jgi:hypothetical protein
MPSKIIACATVIEEMLPFLPTGVMDYQILDFGLHQNPKKLKEMLQNAIDTSVPPVDTIILGYGLCSNAVIGLQANGCRLVVPRIDDCIGIFLGSAAAYRQQVHAEPGTYYLTKGWIEVDNSLFAEYDRLIKRYGPAKAESILRLILKNYTRLAFINTGQYELERYREYARRMAERFGLRYEEIPGVMTLVQKMLFGPWDDEFTVIPPGGSIRHEDFYPLLFQ